MENQPKPLNWVERRARRDSAMRAEAPKLWSDVQAAIQAACESFEREYSIPNGTVTCKPEGENRLVVAKIVPTATHSRLSQIVITFSGEEICATLEGGSPKLTFAVAADDEHVFLRSGVAHLSPDAISENVLNSFLFPPRSLSGSQTGSGLMR